MTAPSFTPGPWRFVNGHLRRVTAASHPATENAVSICGVHRIGRFVGKENEAEQLANGRLIAAAPELYAALVDAIGIMPPEACGPALAALGKARGES